MRVLNKVTFYAVDFPSTVGSIHQQIFS